MLGFEIYIHRKDLIPDERSANPIGEGLIAQWVTGIHGLAWLDQMVKDGHAQFHGGNGYPLIYSAVAKYIVPHLPTGPITAQPENSLFQPRLKPDLIASCPADQLLHIEAWDQS